MVFGQTVTLQLLVPGGIALVLILVFQILTGKRIIRFKGRTHMKVHTWVAYLMGVVAFVHALLGLALAYDWTIL